MLIDSRITRIHLLPLLILTCVTSACQTFNIQIIAPTESASETPINAATLPATWTSTPVPENLIPLESLTPVAPEEFTQGPDWTSPEIADDFLHAQFQIGEFINFAKVVGGKLIVGDNSGTLTILELSDPTNPRPLSNLYLGTEERNLSLEPGDPFNSSIDRIPAELRDVEYEAGKLYAITIHRLLIFDITDPSYPARLGSMQLPPRLNDLSVEDSYVRVLTSDGKMDEVRVMEIDAINPADLTIDFEARFPGTAAGRARMEQNLAYISKRTLENAEQLMLYALEDQRSPVKLGEVYGAPAFRAWVKDNFAYISTARIEMDIVREPYAATASIWVVDISDPEDPTSHSYIWTPGVATGILLTDENAYVIGASLDAAFGRWDEEYWMAVADVSDPLYPLVFRTLDLPGQGLHITGTRGVVYVAAGQGGLQIMRPEEGEALRVLEGDDIKSDTMISALPAAATGTPTPSDQTIIDPTPTYSATYLAHNIDEYGNFTVYWERSLWEQAIRGGYSNEDFEKDSADYGTLAFPYLTGNGFMLEGGKSAQIIESPGLLESGNLLHFRDWEDGITFSFPEGIPVTAFGFDYKPSEDWALSILDTSIVIPKGRRGFIGIVMDRGALDWFNVSSESRVQGGITMDNISFKPTVDIFPTWQPTATGTPGPFQFATGTPTSNFFD